MAKMEIPKGYLTSICKTFNPQKEYLKYVRSEYMINNETKQRIIREVGSDAFVLYDYIYDKRQSSFFVPTDNEAIAKDLGWSKSKVGRIKTILFNNDFLYISKETTREGTTLYKTILNTKTIKYIKEHNKLPDHVDFDVIEVKTPSKNK